MKENEENEHTDLHTDTQTHMQNCTHSQTHSHTNTQKIQKSLHTIHTYSRHYTDRHIPLTTNNYNFNFSPLG